MRTAVGGVLVLIGLCMDWLGQGVSYVGTLIEALGNKLNRENVVDIRRGLARGETCRALAKIFGVSEGHVSDIKDRSRWAHI